MHLIGDLLLGRSPARGSSDTDASQKVIAVPRHSNKTTTTLRAMIVSYILVNESTSKQQQEYIALFMSGKYNYKDH